MAGVRSYRDLKKQKKKGIVAMQSHTCRPSQVHQYIQETGPWGA
jgi:hypothetical protein